MDNLARDLRYAARSLRAQPGWTATIVLTLALAVGANTAIFSAVHGVLIRPLPYPESDRIVRIFTAQPENRGQSPSSLPDFFDWKQGATSFDAMEGFGTDRVVLGEETGPPIVVLRSPPGLLNLIGARPVLGRLIGDEDLRPGAPPVVVLAHAFWTSRFGADPGIVGQSVRLGTTRSRFSEGIIVQETTYTSYTVIGVASAVGGPVPGDFQLITPWDIESDSRRDVRTNWFLPIIARLRPGVSVSQGQAELTRIQAGLQGEVPDAASPVVVSLHDATVADARPALMALFGATSLILMIAIGNIANVLLARGSARRRELSVRSALGAGRLQLARLLLTESVLLALLGGAGGVLLGYAGMKWIVSLEPAWIPRLGEISMDGAVLAATLAVSIAAGLAFGMAPVFLHRNASMWRGGTVGGEPEGGRGRLRSGLIVAQIALSLVLLTGAGLMIRSFLALQAVPVGIDYEQTITFSLGPRYFLLSESGAGRVARLQRYREALASVRAIPGVRDVTLTSQPPLTASGGSIGVEIMSGLRSGEGHSPVGVVAVEENFFDFFGSVAIEGRLFEPADAFRADSVVVVDSNMAAQIWPNEPAVGQRLRFYGAVSEVIGVVEPIRYNELAGDMTPKLFHLMDRAGGGMFGSTALVRHDGDAEPIMAAIETRLGEQADKSIAPTDLQPLSAMYDQFLREPRFYALLFGGLGVLALAVAAVGVYGVIAYTVEQRAGEIGIRIALGAGRRHLVSLVCWRTIVFLFLGVGAGALGAVWLTRYLETLLFGIEPIDPVSFVGMAALLAATAVTATLIPMRRAFRIDPAATLRGD